MNRFLPPALTALLTIAVLLIPLPAPAHAAGSGPITVYDTSPAPGSLTNNPEPTLSAKFQDSGGIVLPSSVYVTLDNINITGFDGFVATSTGFSYPIPTILRLHNGNHTVTVALSDTNGNYADYSWGFQENTSATLPNNFVSGINGLALVEYIALGTTIALGVFFSYIYYLRRTRKFTFKKYFATHQIHREYLTLAVPCIVGLLVALAGLGILFGAGSSFALAPEYIVILAAFIALTPYGVDSRREMQRIRAYERAFAQFLFEMADAMRGGLDPAKALIELSQTEGSILKKLLRVAADGIRLGRPFEDVLRTMSVPIKSRLVTRYAELIADSSSVGGETAVVVHRAAKDMDDFIKIEQERRTALSMPIAVLYLAFGILMAVLFSLLSIAPSLGSLNLQFLSGSGLPSSGATPARLVPALTTALLRERFFDLMIINAIGTGVIIGVFSEGKAKYGLLHALVLLAATGVAFLLFAP